MEQYIPKSALVAEIERKKKEEVNYDDDSKSFASYADHIYYLALDSMQDFINTLEVKEVDLDFMLHKYWNLSSKITIDCLESVTMTKDEMINFAKHFFELGLKAQKGE